MGTSVDTTWQPDLTESHPEPALLVRLDKKTQARYPLNRPRLTLGRAPTSDIVLDASSGVSRDHAHVLVIDGEVVVEDLGSRNGTFVNGKLAARRTLRPGDRIAIGRYRLHFLHEPQAPAAIAPPENEITTLFRLWGPAAVAADAFGCPLCNAPAIHDDSRATPESETGEYPGVEQNCADWFADESATDAGEDDHETGHRIPAVEAEGASEGNYPELSVVSGAADPPESEDEIMAKVMRLVGLADEPGEEAPPPATTGHDARAKIQSRKSRPKRDQARRRKPSRKRR